MGKGKKKHTTHVPEKSSFQPNKGIDTARNLVEEKLAGVIFGCKHCTIEECFANELFGLPEPHYIYVRKIRPGLPLFLFNYSDRRLHGIFEAVCPGRMNINPKAWSEDESYSSPYPAQVKFRIRMHCKPLRESQFGPIVAENYYGAKLFWFELDKKQANELISLFSSFPMSPKEINHQKALFGSYARGKQKLEHQFDDKEKQQEVAYANTSSGLSYSSVVKSTSSSIAHKDQPHASMGTSFQKPWSALFDKETVHDVKSGTECSMIQTALNDSYMDQPNLKWESSPSTCQDDLVSEVSTREDSGNCGIVATGSKKDEVDEFGWMLDERQWSPSHETNEFGLAQDERQWISSHEADEFSLTQDERQWSFVPLSWGEDSQPAEDHRNGDSSKNEWEEDSQPAEDHKNGDSFKNEREEDSQSEEVNKNGNSSESEWEEDSQSVEDHKNGDSSKNEWDEDSLPAEVYKNGDLYMKEHLYKESYCGHSLLGPMENIVLVENRVEDDTLVKSIEPIVSESQRLQVCSMVSKILQQVQELKESQSAQSQRISLLEQELATSRLEIQQLKDAQKTSESRNLYFEEFIFIAGGFDGTSWFSSLDVYSPFEDLKRPLAQMSSSRAHASAVNLNGQLYVLGGTQGDCLCDIVESYNPTSNKWISHPPLIEKKEHMAGVSFDKKIFSIGGGNEAHHFAGVEMLDVNAERWIQVQSMLEKRSGPAAAELGGAVYVVGGYNGKGFLDSVERFDPREPSWTQLKCMTSRRAFHSLVVLNDKLYTLGGYNGLKMLPSVEIFDPRLGSWMTGRSMSKCRGYFGAFVMKDAIYVLGGLNENNEILETVECYKEASGWQSTNLRGIGKRCFFASAVL